MFAEVGRLHSGMKYSFWYQVDAEKMIRIVYLVLHIFMIPTTLLEKLEGIQNLLNLHEAP